MNGGQRGRVGLIKARCWTRCHVLAVCHFRLYCSPCLFPFTCTLVCFLLKELVLFKGHLHRSKEAGWLLPQGNVNSAKGRLLNPTEQTPVCNDILFPPAITAFHTRAHIHTQMHTHSVCFPRTAFFSSSRLLVSSPHPDLTVLAVFKTCDL